MRALRAACATFAALAAAAAPADAHGFYATPTVQIPPWIMAVGAGLVVAVSFLAIAKLLPEARLSASRERALFGGPFLEAVSEVVGGVLGLVLLVVVVYAGLRGTQEFDENFATVFVFITFWVGLVVVSTLLGDVYRLFNPWRAGGRLIGTVVGRRLYGDAPAADYPAWLGRLPAVAALLGFGFLELQGGSTPRDVAIATLIYSFLTWSGMAMFGVERWCARGEGFTIYFNLFSRLAPFAARDGRVFLRRPLAGLTGVDPLPGTTLTLAAIIGVVSFDGFSNSELWAQLQKPFVDAFDNVLGQQGAARVSVALGIAAMTTLIYSVYRIGIAAGADPDGPPPRELARRLAPSLVPIALAYTLAHYMQYLLVRGQAIVSVVSNPLGHSADLFGTASYELHTVFSPTAYWYLEVAAVVVGHVAATFAAHDLALGVYGEGRAAVRSQRWLVVIMIALSVFALWLLARASEIPFSSA